MIKSVYFKNYKGMDRRVNLSRLNLLTGKNGSGKTAVGSAIYIALKGKHPYLGDVASAIRKEASSDHLVFELEDDNISIMREYNFGDKVPHILVVNGEQKKIKEGQAVIDAVYPDSITRLDIGKFIKMNDIDRSIVLSELLGSAKAVPRDIKTDTLNEYFRLNPESDYVIKYALGQTADCYDKEKFVKAMLADYRENKNPVITEALDTISQIMDDNDKGEPVDLSTYLDKVYDTVKKYRNQKAQEKQYAQKAFSEMSTGSEDVLEISRGIDNATKNLADTEATLVELRRVLDTLRALSPATTKEEAEVALANAESDLADLNDKKATIEEELSVVKEDLSAITELSKQEAAYQSWESLLSVHKDSIAKVKAEIEELNSRIVPESDDNAKKLEAYKTVYMSLKDLLPGECPACGTVITEQQATERKAAIKIAKNNWSEAEKELNIRKSNSMIKEKVKLLKSQVAGFKSKLEELQKDSPQKPPAFNKAKEDELKNLESNKEAEHREIIKKINACVTVKANAKAQIEKHAKYENALRDNNDIISIYGSDMASVEDSLAASIQEIASKKQEHSDVLAKWQAEKMLNEKLSGEQERILSLQVTVDTLGAVADVLRQYKNDSVKKRIEPVAMLAKKYYPIKSDEIVLTPETIGVNRNDAYVEQGAMSAGESLSLMSAVLIAIIETSGAKPNYLFVDAAEIDENNMGILLDALKKSSIEMVIVAHHMDIAAPDGWNHINMEVDNVRL